MCSFRNPVQSLRSLIVKTHIPFYLEVLVIKYFLFSVLAWNPPSKTLNGIFTPVIHYTRLLVKLREVCRRQSFVWLDSKVLLWLRSKLLLTTLWHAKGERTSNWKKKHILEHLSDVSFGYISVKQWSELPTQLSWEQLQRVAFSWEIVNIFSISWVELRWALRFDRDFYTFFQAALIRGRGCI